MLGEEEEVLTVEISGNKPWYYRLSNMNTPKTVMHTSAWGRAGSSYSWNIVINHEQGKNGIWLQ